ncbi:hypothetical protein HF1_08380 [Mycoplasma haemofelis str. Langford 1]|uniref:Uncharacterized protein n=2 Tax=Mycoplasma haemofelis TaxID=29501 RepID=F6FIX7_MYCHI|nr:hypothetical protein [Mycoplasma haemofelis]AEG73175.1 hypothetical protein MHF_0918 [Mycoplasma haemofelis Ohio2]CBY92846.1 hypothetical protein HF1_08380 [Mycoplasma haemofelis str. Langford 1]
MNKLLLPLAGLGGAGAAGLGSYMLLKDKEEGNTTKQEATFRDKYSQAILNNESSLWTSKFTILKDGGQPKHPKLQQAKTKFTVKSDDSDAQSLHKDGCKEIYDSKVEESIYFQDFKKYCSKNVGDGVTEAWITVDKKDSSKWDPKLNKLKNHNEANQGALDDVLKSLREKLTSGSQSTWDEGKRGELKQWCDGVKSEIFMGDADIKFANSKLYCAGA